MKVSLNGASLNAGGLSFEQFVDLAARHGYDGVDFSLSGAAKTAGGADAVADLLASKGIAPASFGLEVEWRKDEETFTAALGGFEEKLPLARAIGANRCCTWLPPGITEDTAAWEANVVRRFRTVARMLADHGVRFGLEWVGPRHVREGKTPWVYTMDGLLALIETIGEPNVGLLVDSYHCYTTGVTREDLSRLADSQIVHVHINDAPKGVGRDNARDNERVLPGAGEIDLASFLDGLRGAGYSGFIATEVLAKQPIAADAETAAAAVRSALRGVGL